MVAAASQGSSSPPLSGLHLLLTYQCNFTCDHCFVWGGPYQVGTMTLDTVDHILNEAESLGTIKWIYFEGGEAFLYYAILRSGVLMYTSSSWSRCALSRVPNAETWVLEYQDRPVSFITLVGDKTRGLFLDPASHGKGLGRAMVDHIVALKSLMHIEVFEKNDIG